MTSIAPWVLERLTCPRDGEPLRLDGDALSCRHGHSYPVIEGIPVLLRDDVEPTHGYFAQTFDWVKQHRENPAAPRPETLDPQAVDPFVQNEIALTNGFLYIQATGKLRRYPIPHLRLPLGNGETLLDVGCNWGRWSLSAARANYHVVGIDPSIEAVRAGQRIARQLGLDVSFVVADARHLPFRRDGFDVTFSNGVLQHLDKQVVRVVLKDMARVARRGGSIVVQMPNIFGIRQMYQAARQRLFRDRNPFRVRHWTPRELQRTFEEIVGPSRLEIDGFFSLNPQISDIDLLPPRYARIVQTSEQLRKASKWLPMLRNVADSLYVKSVKPAA